MALVPPAQLEALLFAAGEPLSRKRILKLLDISEKELGGAIEVLNETLEGHGLALVQTDEELELRTAPEAFDIVKRFRESELKQDIGKASLETLAIILYKDGATRGEIDYVRGVNSTAALRALSVRGLVHRTEDKTDRRRIRYTATTDALSHLGVKKVSDLPHFSEYRTAVEERAGAATP